MDKRITRYTSHAAMKADQSLAWQRLPPSERIRAVMDLTLDLYALKGQVQDAPRLQRTLVRVQRGCLRKILWLWTASFEWELRQ